MVYLPSFTNMGPPNRLTDPHFIHSQKRDVPIATRNMALVNAFSSLSIAAPAKAAGLGFKKAVAAFVPVPAARVSARAVFTVEAKQNKKARTIQVRATHDP
jgi:hypothetical protein